MSARIQRKRTKGWRLPPGAVIVDRTSRWGNPFRIGRLVMEPGPWNRPACPYDGILGPGRYTGLDICDEPYPYVIRPVRDRADAVALYEAYVKFHDDVYRPELIVSALGGHDLACPCPLDEPCHADVLLRLANPAEVPGA